ncbi:hypothetical protein P9112_000762 [Eukaryota sp. TZLM1-RC]
MFADSPLTAQSSYNSFYSSYPNITLPNLPDFIRQRIESHCHSSQSAERLDASLSSSPPHYFNHHLSSLSQGGPVLSTDSPCIACRSPFNQYQQIPKEQVASQSSASITLPGKVRMEFDLGVDEPCILDP